MTTLLIIYGALALITTCWLLMLYWFLQNEYVTWRDLLSTIFYGIVWPYTWYVFHQDRKSR